MLIRRDTAKDLSSSNLDSPNLPNIGDKQGGGGSFYLSLPGGKKKKRRRREAEEALERFLDHYLGEDDPHVQSMLPNIEEAHIPELIDPVQREFRNELYRELDETNDLETKLNKLRRFKRKKSELLLKQDLEELITLPALFRTLSFLADEILIATYHLAQGELAKTYGYPAFLDNDGNLLLSKLAIIGMGKLGGTEIHYGSDLDLVFIYSRGGDTEGRRSISNQEYYFKLVQKIISYLSVYMMEGVAYKVDTQLRPSGSQGALVTSFDAYALYQRNVAQYWEKQALLKARVINQDSFFCKTFSDQFETFVFTTEFPADLNFEMHRLRMRMEKEIAKESSRRLHYKLGFGGLVDIEFAIQYLQLRMGKIFPQIITRNSLEALVKMGERELLPPPLFDIFHQAYLFYRRLEIRMETMFDWKEGYLDPQNEMLENLAEKMGRASGQLLIKELIEMRANVRKTYLRVLQINEKKEIFSNGLSNFFK